MILLYRTKTHKIRLVSLFLAVMFIFATISGLTAYAKTINIKLVNIPTIIITQSDQPIEPQIEPVTPITPVIEQTIPPLPQYAITLPIDLQQYTFDLCNRLNFSYTLVLSIMWEESRMTVKARNRVGWTTYDGLMQLSSSYYKGWAKQYNITNFNPFNARQNIEVATRKLKDLEIYYMDEGYFDDYLAFAVVGAYGLGINGYATYIKKHKHQPKYVLDSYEYKEQLETVSKFQ
ncbi:MAG TPA: lytic transglycosylase domain-containing protein [Candidatus Paceibacterota bacterium]